MSARAILQASLSELSVGQEADFFALLSARQELTARDGRRYYRVTFRDAEREVSFPIWGDSPWAEACRGDWQVGQCYKLRATLRETSFGPQLEIERIRPATEQDRHEGFDPLRLTPCSRTPPEAMFDELLSLLESAVSDAALRALAIDLLREHRERLLGLAAATRNHHVYAGGWLEHTLSVTRIAAFLSPHFAEQLVDAEGGSLADVAIVGAALHDLGKLVELEMQPQGPALTAAGGLLGHLIQGRDLLRAALEGRPIAAETALRLEHILVSHQRVPEGMTPHPVCTPEALVVQAADDLDARLQMMTRAIAEDQSPGPMTSRKNVLMQELFKGLPPT